MLREHSLYHLANGAEDVGVRRIPMHAHASDGVEQRAVELSRQRSRIQKGRSP